MKAGAQSTMGLVVTAFFLAAGLIQGQATSPTSPPLREVPPVELVPRVLSSIRVVREIDDPHNGDRWLLVRDLGQPGWPGQMILASDAPAAIRHLELGTEATSRTLSAAPAPASLASRVRPIPVIHTGDRLILEETTSAVDTRLEAVALGPALTGAPLRVRLAVGGRILKALALGAGRVTFAPEGGFQP